MDKIDRFERILGLVEKVRNLDLMTAQVISTINQQQVALYRDITTEYQKDTKPKEEVENQEDKKDRIPLFGSIKKKKLSRIKKEETDMDRNEEIMAFLEETMSKMKRMKEVPPDSPTPPEATTPGGKQDLDSLNKIRQMSTTVAEHLRIQLDIHKYAAAAIAETHKMSFDLYKEIDQYMKQTSS